jgi:NAD(P)-dependent dehydrogenase (short-subunit alcohol dehydrogenase family)
MVLPFWGAYSASKWALEALAETYRVELSDYGVDSCIVEPGPFPTEFFGGLVAADDPARASDYGDMAKAAEQSFADFGKALAAIPAQKPQLVADAIVALIEAPSEQRPLRTTVDEMGIGEHVRQHNASHDSMITAIYENLGIGSTR